MKRFALAATAALGLVTFAAPAQAVLLSWDVSYVGWWEADGGGSVSGKFVADQSAASDRIISIDEMTSWAWNWSGNNAVSAFSISSEDGSTDFSPSFNLGGTPNLPIANEVDPDGLDQGSFLSGDQSKILDLQALIVSSFAEDGTESVSLGNAAATSGRISVSPPTVVPEPTTVLGLLALTGASVATLKRQKQA
jgi:hypothetical protein